MVWDFTKYLAAALLVASPALAQEDLPEAPLRAPVVIELFTSQTCPSCPAADEFLGDLAQDPNIVAISWPVDIWDYLGWEDTLASPDNTRRQAQYNGRFGLRWPYTPEMVINGRTHVAGNQREEVAEMIAAQRADHDVTVPVRVRLTGERLVINVGVGPEEFGEQLGSIWLIPYRTHERVAIEHGPNAGRELTYVNVADGYELVSQWAGSPVIVRLDLDYAPGTMPDGFAVLLQKHRNGPVLGAARLQLQVIGANAE